MKALLRWLAKIVGSAVAILLVIVLFPHMSRIAASLMPDESGAAIKASVILAASMENAARLETFTVKEDGVLNYDIQAALLGSVANVNVRYVYEASFGIDLKNVSMQPTGNEIVFLLPEIELLQDSLTPQEVYRDDFWYPGFSDSDYERLLADERQQRRNAYLNGEQQELLWAATVEAFEETISAWIQDLDANLIFRYVQAEN